MDMSSNFTLVKDALVELGIPIEEIKPDASLLRDLSIDSTELIELITIIEKQMHIHMDEKQIKNVQTVSELVSFVDNHCQ
jgi:acyl carrier protein